MNNNNLETYPVHAKLTKNIYLSLPTGNCIVSLTFNSSTGQPWFTGVVKPLMGRDKQWERIVQSGAHQRNCLVYENKEVAEQCIDKMLPKSQEDSHYDPFADVSFKDGKLSKSVLNNWDEGVVFMSRVLLLDGSPEFSGIVAPTAKRQEQWKQLSKQGFAQRRCFLFSNKADMEKYRAYMHNAYDRKDSLGKAAKGGES
ncbi:hypothetical protein ACFL0B_07700 [Thermodesulfobacteriota bacterium]